MWYIKVYAHDSTKFLQQNVTIMQIFSCMKMHKIILCIVTAKNYVLVTVGFFINILLIKVKLLFLFSDIPVVNSIRTSFSETGTVSVTLDPIVTAVSYHYSVTVSSQGSTYYTHSTTQTEFSIADSGPHHGHYLWRV